MVMATGIVSLAADLRGYTLIARELLWLNVSFYVALWALTMLRLATYPRLMLADLSDHNRGVGYFTLIAGTGVLGSQTLLIGHSVPWAATLWLLTGALWVFFIYGVFTGLTVKAVKPTLVQGINGAWLVAVVATQSLSILGAQLAGYFDPGHDELVLFVSLALWLSGGMLYITIISLIFYRYLFYPLTPAQFTSPYWINMGAVAISTLAGTMLLLDGRGSALVTGMVPFVEGFTVFFWATATWWIPILVIMGYWRYVSCRFPLRYDPLHWGGVFPLGMYTACTLELSRVLGLPALMIIPHYFFYIAVAAWSATAAGLAVELLKSAWAVMSA